MASQNPLDRIGGLSASADLSAKQYYFVKIDGDYSVGLCDTDGEFPIGVLQNEPTSGQAATVEMAGATKVVAAEALTAGDFVGTDANGKAKIVQSTNTGADIGDWLVGIVIEGAGADEIATIKLGFAQRVEAA